MVRKTGFTETTTKKLVLDAGVVYLNWGSTDQQKPQIKMGACRGGNSYTIETNWRVMPFDGVPENTMGTRRPLGVTVTLEANLVEVSKEMIRLAIPGATFDGGSPAVGEDGQPVAGETHYSIKRVLTEAIPVMEHSTIAIVAQCSGTNAPVICVIKNALSLGSFNFAFADQDESAPTLTLTGQFDPANFDEEPWEIIYPEKTPTA